MDKNLSGYKKCSETRDSLGRLTTPYPEKRSQARGVRFPPCLLYTSDAADD